jgi:Tol biopolymer transport system component
VAVSGTTVAGSAAAGTGAPANLPPAFRIAFVSNRDGSDDIWTMDPDGGRLTNLTHKQKQKVNDSDPQWSPDGSRIAYVSDWDGHADIWVMNQDGSAARNLTPGGGDDVSPRWSPDGKRIAFASFRDADGEIYVMSADGGDQTDLSKADGDDLQPVWSPDGAQIAFVSERGKRPRALYTLSVATPKDPFRVAGPACDLRDPAWSPDGKTLAVVGCVGADGKGAVDATQHVVYTIPAGGGTLTAVSDPKMESGDPIFAPDSRSLAFLTYRSPKEADIVVLTLAGNARRIIQGVPGAAREPAWSMDGAQIAFVAGDFTVGNIIVTDPSGLTHNLTNGVANERTPRWSPVKLP